MGKLPWKSLLTIVITVAVASRIDYLRGLVFQPRAKK